MGHDGKNGNGCILIVEDDQAIRDMLAEYLAAHDYAVFQADCGAAMRASLERQCPDVVLLDVNLPGEDGFSLARYLRERYRLGIIMVTAADDVVDRVVGLELGADDYVTKPFDLRELRARIKSVMRRVHEGVTQADAKPPSTEGTASPAQSGSTSTRLSTVPGTQRIPIGSHRLDLGAHALLAADGTEIELTAMEFELLRVFAEHPRQVLSRDQLLQHTRNREWEPYDRSIDIRIARLRRKIESDPDKPRLIRTMRGAGYMYVPGEE